MGLGFTGLEAAIYRCLVEHAPATGYRVAQQLGKPIANTYKALESLEAKGAVLIEEGEHRRCRAVAPAELLARLERSFRERCASAEAALRGLEGAGHDDRVYPIRTKGQALERARSMIDGASTTVLIDAFAAPIAALRGCIEAARDRGVRVGLLGYEPSGIEGVIEVVAGTFEWLSRWPGEQLVVVSDATQHLASVIERAGDGVVQAIWSPSLILAVSQHDGLMSQMIAHMLDTQMRSGASLETLRRERERLRGLSLLNTPGFAKLVGRHTQESAGRRTRDD